MIRAKNSINSSIVAIDHFNNIALHKRTIFPSHACADRVESLFTRAIPNRKRLQMQQLGIIWFFFKKEIKEKRRLQFMTAYKIADLSMYTIFFNYYYSVNEK